MDIKLKLFCMVAETKSFSRTSRIVHLSQPAVSLQIQALEEFFETKLFNRAKDSITLTPVGEILYKHAKHVLEHYSEIEKDIGKLTGMMKGGVTFGAGAALGNYVMPRVIIEFKKKYPKVKITMLVGNTNRIEDLLSSGLIDFGIVAGEPSRETFNREAVASDELTLIFPPAHPWSRKKSISILDMTREPFILREEGSGTRKTVEDFFLRHGIELRNLHIPLVLGSAESVKEAVEAGIGISMVSKWSVRKETADRRLATCHIKEGRIERRIFIITPHKSIYSPAVQEFLLFARKYPYNLFFSDAR